jgi:N-acetylglutamate synthase-like GNAT family acetyltransferase
MAPKFTAREACQEDTEWIKQVFIQNWGGDFVVSRGNVYKIEEFDGGYVAERLNKRVGLITYKIVNNELEITGLISDDEKKGIGTALVNSVITAANQKKIKRICLVTTNDNLNALGFWQKRGFNLVRVYPSAIEATRRLKPSVPLIGENNIPLRDEIELEMKL